MGSLPEELFAVVPTSATVDGDGLPRLPELTPIIAISVPLAPLLELYDGGLEVESMYVRVNESSVTPERLAEKRAIASGRNNGRTQRRSSIPVLAEDVSQGELASMIPILPPAVSARLRALSPSPGDGTGRYGVDIPEDSVQVDRGSVMASPIQTIYGESVFAVDAAHSRSEQPLSRLGPSGNASTTNNTAGPAQFLDCFSQCPEADGNSLAHLLGAISYSLHRVTDYGYLYAKVLRQLYAVDDPQSKKTKLPLDKLLMCLCKPSAVYPGVALEFLILEQGEEEASIKQPTIEPNSTNISCGALKTVLFSYAAELLVDKAHRRFKAKGTLREDITVTDTRAVLVCLKVDRSVEFPITHSGFDTKTTKHQLPPVAWSAMQCDLSVWQPKEVPMLGIDHFGGRPEQPFVSDDESTSENSSTEDSSEGSSEAELFEEKDDNADVQDERRIVLAGTDFVADAADNIKRPFDGMIYPTLDMADTGFFAMLARSLHKDFALNRIRFPSTIACLLIVIGCASAILHMAHETFEACCVPEGALTDTVDPECVYNLTSSSVAEMLLSQCEVDMCLNADGRLRSRLPQAFLWGAQFSTGRLLVAAIVVSIISLALTMLVSFFATRPVALGGGAEPRFFVVPYFLHLVAGGLIVAATVYIAVDFFEPNHIVSDCSIFGAESQHTALCRAEYDNCDVKFVVYFKGTKGASVIPWLAIVMGLVAILQLVFSIVPPLLAKFIREEIRPAVPDTMIFKVGKYAPDGINEEEILELQREIRATWRKERSRTLLKAAELQIESLRTRDSFVNRPGHMIEADGKRGADSKGLRLRRLTQLLMLKKKGSTGLRFHYPDPLDGIGQGVFLPESVQDTIEDIGDKVLERLRSGKATNNFVAPRRATVWDLMMNTAKEAIVEERKRKGPTTFLTTIKELNADKMDAKLHEESLQRKVIDGIAYRLAVELAARSGQGASSPSQAAAVQIYPASMMVPIKSPVPRPDQQFEDGAREGKAKAAIGAAMRNWKMKRAGPSK